jgi:hypothetical protein
MLNPLSMLNHGWLRGPSGSPKLCFTPPRLARRYPTKHILSLRLLSRYMAAEQWGSLPHLQHETHYPASFPLTLKHERAPVAGRLPLRPLPHLHLRRPQRGTPYAFSFFRASPGICRDLRKYMSNYHQKFRTCIICEGGALVVKR